MRDNQTMRAVAIILMLVAAPLAQERPFDAAQGRPLPDFNTFSAQVRKHLATDEERQSGYVYVERRTEQTIDDLFRIYDIRMIRREPIDGHVTIVATLDPNENVKPRTDDGNIMRNFKARAWSAKRTTSSCAAR